MKFKKELLDSTEDMLSKLLDGTLMKPEATGLLKTLGEILGVEKVLLMSL